MYEEAEKGNQKKKIVNEQENSDNYLGKEISRNDFQVTH